MVVDEQGLPPWRRRSVHARLEQRAAQRVRDQEWRELTARWPVPAQAARSYSPPRRRDGSPDIRQMLADGLASAAAFEARRQAQHDRNAGARARGQALYESVYAQKFGRMPPGRPSVAERTGVPGYAVIGAVPPDPSSVPLAIF